MKGRAARHREPTADMAAARNLAANPKDRAEYLMIVDLLRNDLSQVSTPGSVKVTSLFDVETYPTVHQMTSTITSCLAADCDAVTLLTAIFPCGSVTGAPKSGPWRSFPKPNEGRAGSTQGRSDIWRRTAPQPSTSPSEPSRPAMAAHLISDLARLSSRTLSRRKNSPSAWRKRASSRMRGAFVRAARDSRTLWRCGPDKVMAA